MDSSIGRKLCGCNILIFPGCAKGTVTRNIFIDGPLVEGKRTVLAGFFFFERNRISRLKRVDGSWTSDTNEMEMITRDFFQGLYAQDEHIDHSIITNLLISVWTMTQMRSSVHLSPRKKLVMLSFKLGR